MNTLTKTDVGKIVTFTESLEYGIITNVYEDNREYPVEVAGFPLPIPNHIAKALIDIKVPEDCPIRSYTYTGSYTSDGNRWAIDIESIISTPQECTEVNKKYFTYLVNQFLCNIGIVEQTSEEVAAKVADTLIDIIHQVR